MVHASPFSYATIGLIKSASSPPALPKSLRRGERPGPSPLYVACCPKSGSARCWRASVDGPPNETGRRTNLKTTAGHFGCLSARNADAASRRVQHAGGGCSPRLNTYFSSFEKGEITRLRAPGKSSAEHHWRLACPASGKAGPPSASPTGAGETPALL